MAHAAVEPGIPGLLVPPALPAAAPDNFEFLRTYAFSKAGGDFLCLGRGGNGGVYDATRNADAPVPGWAAESPYRALALSKLAAERTIVAAKQSVHGVILDPYRLELVRKSARREGAESVALAEQFMARSAWRFLTLTFDHFQFRNPGEVDCTLHTVMERSPIGRPTAAERDDAPGEWPRDVLPARSGAMIGSNTDVLGCPFFRAGHLEMREARYIMRQLLEALRALHKVGRVHRDVKPDNILIWGCSRPGAWEGHVVPATEVHRYDDGLAVMVDRRLQSMKGAIAPPEDTLPADELVEGNPFICTSLPFPADDEDTNYVWIKLCDFGLTRGDLDDRDLTHGPGSHTTKAPEVVTPRYDARVDVFSAGCVFYSLLTGGDPLPRPELCLEEGRFPLLNPPPPAHSGRVFSEGSDELALLRYMTRRSLEGENARPFVEDVLKHKFFD